MVLYNNIKEGIFLKRPNRFLAHVLIDQQEEICHVKNTGRCRELLIPEVTQVFVEDYGEKAGRKTRYSLVQAMKGDKLVNIDSQAPNKVGWQWVEQGHIYSGLDILKPEKVFGDSRFDLYAEGDGKKAFIEIKGVTLEENGIALFPDAPTERGLKHIKELCRCIEEGYEAYILFVIQMKGVTAFRPNDRTQPEFGEALAKAREKGVHILALDCKVGKNYLEIDKEVPLQLK